MLRKYRVLVSKSSIKWIMIFWKKWSYFFETWYFELLRFLLNDLPVKLLENNKLHYTQSSSSNMGVIIAEYIGGYSTTDSKFTVIHQLGT